MRRLVLAVLLLGPCVLFGREKGWRLSVGGGVIGGVKSRVGVSHSHLRAASGFGSSLPRPSGSSGRSKADAYAAGAGTLDGANGTRRFDDGAWYDPNDSAGDDWSWNWRLHDPSGPDPDGYAGFVERTAYAESCETMSISTCAASEGMSSASDEWFPGLRIEIARELYCNEGERPWGVDIALGFSYYFQRNLWRASGTAARADVTRTTEEGCYEWWNDSGNTARYILDYERDTQFRDGMWGAGTFDGPGAELNDSAWKWRDVPGQSSESVVASQSLRYDAHGDYREYAIDFIARPWWEPWEWLRIFASVGLEASRREFEWSLSASGTDGSCYSERGKEKDWRLFGLLGGGLAVQYDDFFLAGELLYRLWGDELNVRGESVNGSIEHGDWGVRLSLGYVY